MRPSIISREQWNTPWFPSLSSSLRNLCVTGVLHSLEVGICATSRAVFRQTSEGQFKSSPKWDRTSLWMFLLLLLLFVIVYCGIPYARCQINEYPSGSINNLKFKVIICCSFRWCLIHIALKLSSYPAECTKHNKTVILTSYLLVIRLDVDISDNLKCYLLPSMHSVLSVVPAGCLT